MTQISYRIGGGDALGWSSMFETTQTARVRRPTNGSWSVQPKCRHPLASAQPVLSRKRNHEPTKENMSQLSTALRSVTLAGLCGLGLTAAMADEPAYYYGGLSVGRARSTIDEGQLARAAVGGAPVFGISSNEHDNAYKLFGGYQFNRNMALELGYFDLGHTTYSATGPLGVLSSDTQVRGFNLDVVGTLHLSDTFAVIGRVGAAAGRATATFTGPGAVGIAESTKNQTNAKVGVGLQWEMSRSVWLRGEVERYRVNNAMGSHNNVDVYTVSLVMPFGRGAMGNTVRPVANVPQR